MLLDVLGTREHYWHHLGPVWDALGPASRGERLTEVQRTTSQRPDRAVLVSSARDLTQASRLGYGRVAYVEHGIGQPYSGTQGYPGGRGRDPVGLFLSPNATAAAADRAAYPQARVEVVGNPGLVLVPHREPGPPAIAVSFHWECHLLPETRSAFAHYRRILPVLAAGYPVLGHGHPLAQGRLRQAWERIGVEFVPDWHEVARRADLYVCDNSSTLYEFASTGRPVVVLNAPWYRRTVEHGLRFWRAAGVGVACSEPEDLLGAVEVALRDPGWQRGLREQALGIVYADRIGAAARAARVLEGWLA